MTIEASGAAAVPDSPDPSSSSKSARGGGVLGTLQRFQERWLRELKADPDLDPVQVALYRIAVVSRTTESLADCYREIHGAISDLMYARNFYIALCDADHGTLQFPYFVDENDEPPAPRRFGRGLTEYVIRKGEALLADREAIERLDREGELDLHGTPPVEWLGVPLFLENRPFGLVAVQSYDPATRFSPDDRHLLQYVSRHVAAAIEHRRDQGLIRKLSEAVRHSPSPTLIADCEGRVEYVNPKFEEVTGYSLDELANGTLPFFSDEEREVIVQRVLAHEVWRGEFASRRKNGEEFWQSVSVSGVFDDRGEMTGVVMLSEDITARREAEKELWEAKRRAEAADRSKSEFLANMSHEIRTPMNAIIGMTDLALDTSLTAEQRDFLTTVKGAADSLLDILNDVLDFSKIEARMLELEDFAFSVRECVGGVVKTLALQAERKGLELVCHVAPEVPDAVEGDPGRIRQILMNLVGNAIKFTEEGEVVVDVALESMGSGDVRLQFTVRDTGIGIPPDRIGHVFEMFTQADSSTTRRFGGTGLGLAISARLVELMDGQISVESEEGKGSEFHFTVRLGLGAGEVAQAPAGRPEIEGLRALIVDDNGTNRRILEEMLVSWKLRPTVVESGAAALEALGKAHAANDPFSLVLLDVQMPEMDGFTVAQKIKDRPEAAGSVIMMLSSMTRRGDAERCRRLGVAGYLVKPITQAELWSAMVACLRSGADAAEEQSLVTRQSLRENRKPRRVLLAEDNHVNQKLAVKLLEREGHSVSVVENGLEAVAAVEKGAFDVVLMDVQMPEMSGLEATVEIRRREGQGPHVPIIAMTAHAMKGDEERCLAAGMDAYVSKPIRREKLLEVLDALT